MEARGVWRRLSRGVGGVGWRRRVFGRRRGREILIMARMTVDELSAALERALGPRLVSFLLYGSAASGAHVPERSDVNTLLVCDAADEALFTALEPPVRAWVGAGHPAPLIFTEREWRESVDAFAIEYEDIRHAHRVLAGRDPRVAQYLQAVAQAAQFVNGL